MSEQTASDAPPLLVVAEFVFSESGESAFEPHRARTLDEVRNIDGCLLATLWQRPGRRYMFWTLWRDAASVTRWVDCEFHRSVLMPGFRKWCTEGSFGEYGLSADHQRARRCAECGRWTQSLPGWDERLPVACQKCDASLPVPEEGVIA